MRKLILIIYVIFFICSCNRKETNHGNDTHSDSLSVFELPFPEIPENLADGKERANYVLKHFWDKMNFSDTTLSHNEDFLAQTFVNFISIYPYASDSVQYMASAKLLKKAQSDSIAYNKLIDVIERYLYDIESPMLSEEIYIHYLRAIIADSYTSGLDREVAELKLEEVLKNRKGTVATDFNYITRDGEYTSLHKTKSGSQLMLIFYDPDCEVCKDVINKLRNDIELNHAIAREEMSVLAIYSGQDRERWDNTKDSLPSNWLVGFEPGMIDQKELYILRATPTIYLLNGKTKEVLVKDIPVNQL